MYKKLENPLPPRFGRMFACKNATLNQSAPEINDIVQVRVDDVTDFYIFVEESVSNIVLGEIIGIGPEPLFEYKGWCRGEKIEVEESAVAAIIRAD